MELLVRQFRGYPETEFLQTGNLYNEQFAYHEVPEILDPFLIHILFASNPMEFYVVCTDMVTGNAVYHRCEHGTTEDI